MQKVFIVLWYFKQDRSRTLATYALCGFSSLSTLAIAVGVWQVVCPQKVSDMASQMGRALLNANMACFMTACISGMKTQVFHGSVNIRYEIRPASRFLEHQVWIVS